MSAGELSLTADDLREVARFAVAAADEVLGLFEAACPADRRPRAALAAARAFADGAPRTHVLRMAAVDAHRAARETVDEAARCAARAAGDAAAAAFLHPLARATQVGHILRAAAYAAEALGHRAGADRAVVDAALRRTCRRATPVLVDVLRRYPAPPPGTTAVSRTMARLDAALRTGGPTVA